MMFVANLSTLRVDSKPFAEGFLEFDKGDVVGIFGRNGVGKSTVMRELAGLGERSVQRTYLGNTMNPSDLRVNIVFQKDNLIPWLSVVDNLSLSKGIFNPAGVAESRVYLERFGLLDLADRWPRSLSGGETKLVELARAYRDGESGILILDEPFTGLDHEFQIRVEEFIRTDLTKMYDAVVIVSHELVRLAELTTKTYVFLKRSGGLRVTEVIRGDVDDQTYASEISAAFE
jgi:ABC-type nitrate/sulfonate/bicarbonate transport system ATPase subunit